MSDRDALKAMFDRAEVVWSEHDGRLMVEAKTGPNNEGYGGFAVVFDFADDGGLLKTGVWE